MHRQHVDDCRQQLLVDNTLPASHKLQMENLLITHVIFKIVFKHFVTVLTW